MQVGIYAMSMLGIHTHANTAQGGQIDPEMALNPQPEINFGDGSDGDFTAPAGATTLTRDMNYNNLDIPIGSQFIPHGFKVRVKNRINIIAGGYIDGRGGDAASGVAGVGGAGGTSFIATRKVDACRPTDGGAGGSGIGVGVNISVSNTPPDIDLNAVPLLYESRLWAGAGGAGGGAVGNAPTAGGVPLKVLAGAKGGRGADGIYVGGGNQIKGGGGGGGGGSIIEIWAKEWNNLGGVYCSGGSGGVGEGDANAQAGGGGGGGGGSIILYYKTLINAGGLAITGGPGGASFGGLANGLAGETGFISIMQIGT